MKNIYYRIQQWISTNFTRTRFNVIKKAIADPPYDSYYLLALEKAKLEEMRAYFKSIKFFDHTIDIKWISICISLLEIIMEDDPFNPECPARVNVNNMMRFYRIAPNVSIEEVREFAIKHPNDLRILKAKHLYYKIREEYTERWWD